MERLFYDGATESGAAWPTRRLLRCGCAGAGMGRRLCMLGLISVAVVAIVAVYTLYGER